MDFDTLLAQSDIVSVHAPLDANTEHLMNADAFRRMKRSAIFLNLGRGPIVVESDLAEALKSGEIAAAGLDVLTAEPMTADNPLREIKDSGKLIITPHIAWASVEARTRLMKQVAGLDVLTAEPMTADNPLREIKDSGKLIITPHIAWASVEARTRLMKQVEQNIREFFE